MPQHACSDRKGYNTSTNKRSLQDTCADPSCCSTTVLEEKADCPGLAHIGEAQLGLNALPRSHGKEGADMGLVLLPLQAQPSPAWRREGHDVQWDGKNYAKPSAWDWVCRFKKTTEFTRMMKNAADLRCILKEFVDLLYGAAWKDTFQVCYMVWPTGHNHPSDLRFYDFHDRMGSDFNMPLRKFRSARDLAACSGTVFNLWIQPTCLPAFGLATSRAVVLGHPVLSNFFTRHAVHISGRLDLIQATTVSMDRKLEGLGLKRQEAEKKIEDLEITTDGPDAIVTENTAAPKYVINSLKNNLR